MSDEYRPKHGYDRTAEHRPLAFLKRLIAMRSARLVIGEGPMWMTPHHPKHAKGET